MATKPDAAPLPGEEKDIESIAFSAIEEVEKAKNERVDSVEPSETMAGQAESETIIEKRSLDIPGINSTLAEVKDIEKDLSREDLDPKEREILIDQKKKKLEEVLKKECDFFGVKFEDKQEQIKKAVEAAKDAEWNKGLQEFSRKNGIDYEEFQKRAFVNGKLSKNYDDIIRSNKDLSDKQKRDILDEKKGEVSVGGWRSISLSKEDVAICTRLGWDVNEIKFAAFGFSNKIVIEGEKFSDLASFNRRIAFEREKYIQEEVQKTIEEYKEKAVNEIVEPTILESEVKEISAYINRKQKAEKEIQAQEKIEQAENAWVNLSPQEQIKKISDIRSAWMEAKRIDMAVKKGAKIEISEGVTLDASKEEDINQLERTKTDYSRSVVNMINELTGRDLIAEAKKEIGLTDESGAKLSQEERTQRINKWVTQEVKRAYDEKRASIKIPEGKVIKKRKNKKNEGSVIAAPKPITVSEASTLNPDVLTSSIVDSSVEDTIVFASDSSLATKSVASTEDVLPEVPKPKRLEQQSEEEQKNLEVKLQGLLERIENLKNNLEEDELEEINKFSGEEKATKEMVEQMEKIVAAAEQRASKPVIEASKEPEPEQTPPSQEVIVEPEPEPAVEQKPEEKKEKYFETKGFFELQLEQVKDELTKLRTVKRGLDKNTQADEIEKLNDQIAEFKRKERSLTKISDELNRDKIDMAKRWLESNLSYQERQVRRGKASKDSDEYQSLVELLKEISE